MTFADAVEIGNKKLQEYEPRLKERIKGSKPFDRRHSRCLAEFYYGYLAGAKPDAIERVIVSVLERLTKVSGSFWMSEPESETPPPDQRGYDMQTVRHGDLNLTFSYGHDIKDDASRLWVSCWYVT